MNPGTDMLVQLSVADLRELIQDAVTAAIPEPASVPALLDRRGLAQELGCSVDIVDKLRRQGLPTLHVGDAPRFRLSEVIAWLEAREQERAQLGERGDPEPKTAAGANESARENQHGATCPNDSAHLREVS